MSKMQSRILAAVDGDSFDGTRKLVLWSAVLAENIDVGDGIVDQDRYWIALGLKVIIFDYPNDGTCAAKAFKESIGGRVDMALQSMENPEEYVYIECVWSSNIKAHTFNNGIYQTGEPYPESPNAKTEPYDESCVDGSIVEFMGMNPKG